MYLEEGFEESAKRAMFECAQESIEFFMHRYRCNEKEARMIATAVAGSFHYEEPVYDEFRQAYGFQDEDMYAILGDLENFVLKRYDFEV
jgi:hypothetical protein